MSAMSNYLEERVAGAALRGTNFTATGVTYLALLIGQPNEDASNIAAVECNTSTNYPGYARQSFGGDPAVAWTALDANGMSQNHNTLTFPPLGGATPVTVSHWAIFDATSGGNMLFWGAMTTPKTLDPTDVPSFPGSSAGGQGAIRITFL
jgi:hypothetical protein